MFLTPFCINVAGFTQNVNEVFIHYGLPTDDVVEISSLTTTKARYKIDKGDVSMGSDFFICTFCTLLLNCLFLVNDTGIQSQKSL